MRLITRSDFDGLACGALLKEAGIIDSWKFAHPKDLQDGLVEVNENDVLANVPFVEGCGLWFDHHSSEFERNQLEGKYKGESRVTPSCARIIYDYYGGHERFAHFDEMLDAVDKVDSANLTIDDIQKARPDGSPYRSWQMERFYDFQLSADGKTDGSMSYNEYRRDSCTSRCKRAYRCLFRTGSTF